MMMMMTLTGQFVMPKAGTRPPPNDVTALSRDREPPEVEDMDAERSWSSSCRYELVSSASLRSGRVYSPRYPRNFPPDSVLASAVVPERNVSVLGDPRKPRTRTKSSPVSLSFDNKSSSLSSCSDPPHSSSWFLATESRNHSSTTTRSGE